MRSVAGQTVKPRQSKEQRFPVKWRFGLIQLRSVHIPWAKKGICPGAISRAPAKHSYLINQITMWSHPCGPAAKSLTENDGELAN
jgi:hypothetical protein